jgi:hypothetical protein
MNQLRKLPNKGIHYLKIVRMIELPDKGFQLFLASQTEKGTAQVCLKLPYGHLRMLTLTNKLLGTAKDTLDASDRLLLQESVIQGFLSPSKKHGFMNLEVSREHILILHSQSEGGAA